MFDTCIIGGGIVGASVAYHLSKSGQQVILFDRKDKGRATNAGAGIISPPTTYVEDNLLYKFQNKAGKYYPILNDELQSEHQLDTSYIHHPKIVIAVDKDELDDFDTVSERILKRRDQENYPSNSELYSMNNDELLVRFPEVKASEFTKTAIINEKAAKLNGILFSEAMVSAGKNHGLVVASDSVEVFVEEKIGSGSEERKIISITDGQTTWKAKNFVISGGFWSSKLVKQLGLQLPLEPQRGQIIHLYHPDLDTSKIPTIAAFHGHYIVPWDDGTIICGATRETGIFEPNATVDGVQEILSEAVRLIPKLQHASIIEIRVGIRPYSKTGLPIIGSVPNFTNLFISTGHGPLGLTLGPYTGKLLSQLILDGKSEFDTSPFALQ
ncbi:MAG: NAD(P)/FAD-dependent oxidoreductase [Candidatus Kariarchaeaceae archaeon]